MRSGLPGTCGYASGNGSGNATSEPARGKRLDDAAHDRSHTNVGVGVAADVAQAFDDHLKQLGSQPIIDLHFAGGVDGDGDPGCGAELRRETPQGQQEVLLRPGAVFQPPHVTAQVDHASFGHAQQPVDVGGHVGVAGDQPLANRCHPELQADVRLNHAVMNIPRSGGAPLPLRRRRGGRRAGCSR
jgi:hypothetical protein